MLNVHHSLSDGWSIDLMHRELGALYDAYAARRPSPLPPPVLQYADFAAWQRELFAGPALEAQLAYWRRRLADLPPVLDVPTGRPRPPQPGLAARSERLSLIGEAAEQLRQAVREGGCTLAMALLAGIAALLHRYSGAQDVLVATQFSGRTRPELAGVLGLFLNTVMLRIDLKDNPSFRELMQRVRADLLEGYRHQDLPFPLLLAKLFPGQPPSRSLLSRVGFNMLSFTDGAAGGPAPLAGLAVEPFPTQEDRAKTDLIFTCREDADVHVQMTGSRDVCERPVLSHMAEDLAALLVQAAFAPDTPLDRLLPAPRHNPYPAAEPDGAAAAPPLAAAR